ncbi:MAG: type II secretion system protein [Akkermansiaceae bacterium]
MKKQPSHELSRGFTLIELLAVVAIIVVLATIVIGALTQMKKKEAKDKTKVILNRTKVHLEEYYNDNQFYPVGEDVFSEILYTSLSGDFTGRGEGEPEGTIYWRELLNSENPEVGKRSGKRIILDGYNQSIRYRSAFDAEGNEVQSAKNADYDLWSIGPDGEPADPNVDSNLDNEQTVDDIKPD